MGRVTIPNLSIRRRHRTAPGAAPGTLVEPDDLPKPSIERMVYDAGSCERETVDPHDLSAVFDVPKGKCVWVDVQGLGDAEVIRALGEGGGLHPLTIEDIVHVHQRPKLEDYTAYLFTILRALRALPDGNLAAEQVSFVLKDNLLLTFQERPGTLFDPVRQRLKGGRGLIRRLGADYLFYALVDAVVDNYFPVLETYEDNMDTLEDEVRENPTRDTSRQIHTIRYQLRRFRRNVWPLREILNAIVRDESPLIDKQVRVFFRDCQDHVIQVAEFVESTRERAGDLGDLYMSMVSEQTGRVMNLLTIISTIFIPLTFLCGVYGMNFDTAVSPYNMPELKWQYGYPVFWGVLLVIFIGMLIVFKRKGWLGTKR